MAGEAAADGCVGFAGVPAGSIPASSAHWALLLVWFVFAAALITFTPPVGRDMATGPCGILRTAECAMHMTASSPHALG